MKTEQDGAQSTDHLAGSVNLLVCSDITLVVEGIHFPVHRKILSQKNEYFRGLFDSGMREANEPVINLAEKAEAFKILLYHIYNDRIRRTIKKMNVEQLIEILCLAHKCGVSELVDTASTHLEAMIQAENVCAIYANALLYSRYALVSICLDYIDIHAGEVLASEGFQHLPAGSVKQLLERGTLRTPEVEIFMALLRWREHNLAEESHHQELFALVKLWLINLEDLLKLVQPTGMFSSYKLLDAIRIKVLGNPGCLPGINVARSCQGASVHSGQNTSELLGGLDHGFYTEHRIHTGNGGIIVELDGLYRINHICLEPHFHYSCYGTVGGGQQEDECPREAYFYYVETEEVVIKVSIDKYNWHRVIDRTEAAASERRQYLFFEECTVKFVRIVATRCVPPHASEVFTLRKIAVRHVTGDFKAMCSSDPEGVIFTDKGAEVKFPRGKHQGGCGSLSDDEEQKKDEAGALCSIHDGR